MLSGCATSLGVGKAVSGAAVVDEAVMSGEVLDTILSVELSPADMAIVEDTYDFYMRFRSTWAGNPEAVILDPFAFERFKKDYRILANKYNNLKGVVERNAHRYRPLRLGVLRDYDSMANMSYTATNDLIESGEKTQTLNSALEFGTMVSRMVILLL
jgi:hypothetical protein